MLDRFDADFASDARNICFGLATDDFDPFSINLSYLVFMPKPSTHRMYAQDQLFHTYG
jgi:hypothetical protein